MFACTGEKWSCSWLVCIKLYTFLYGFSYSLQHGRVLWWRTRVFCSWTVGRCSTGSLPLLCCSFASSLCTLLYALLSPSKQMHKQSLSGSYPTCCSYVLLLWDPTTAHSDPCGAWWTTTSIKCPPIFLPCSDFSCTCSQPFLHVRLTASFS